MKFAKLVGLGYYPSHFCLDNEGLSRFFNKMEHDDCFDYLLEHMYHIDTHYEDSNAYLRVQGFITPEDFKLGLEELSKSCFHRNYTYSIEYVKGYYKLTFSIKCKLIA